MSYLLGHNNVAMVKPNELSLSRYSNEAAVKPWVILWPSRNNVAMFKPWDISCLRSQIIKLLKTSLRLLV